MICHGRNLEIERNRKIWKAFWLESPLSKRQGSWEITVTHESEGFKLSSRRKHRINTEHQLLLSQSNGTDNMAALCLTCHTDLGKLGCDFWSPALRVLMLSPM